MTPATKTVLCVLCGYLIFVPLVAQERPDRAHPPSLAQPPKLNLPAIQKRALSNGMPVWVVEAHEVPLVQVSLTVLAGANEDQQGKFGVASFTAAMLDEGAGSRSALEISDAVDFLGASLTTGSSFDASVVRLNVPVSRLQEALPIMADLARRPTFPAADLERIRQERLTMLLQARDDPNSVASMAFNRVVFGSTHRYGTGVIGNDVSLKALTAQDLRAFHSAFYQPSNAALVVVGDITAADALPRLEQNFGDWKNGAPVKRTAVPSPSALTGPQILIVDKADAEQSQIRIGALGAPRNTPEFFSLQVLNTVFGGAFSSRLNQNLREAHGYAYGAGSAFDVRLFPGPFVAYAGVQTDKTADALREFFNELSAIRKPVGADELARAKNYIALSFPSEFETAADRSRKLEELIVYRLPERYFDEYVTKIQTVTASEVQQAATKYIQPEHFAVVVVGDRKMIEPGVRMLNLGPVRVVSVEEALGS